MSSRIAADVRVLAVVKGVERYVWVFDAERKDDVLRSLGRMASNKDLSLTWYDAAVCSQRLRKDDA